MFECSLDGRPAADFSVAAIASRGDPAALARCDLTDTTPPFANPGWRRIREFAHLWTDSCSSLSRTVEEVWLEFDVCLTQDAPGNTPSVFFSLGYQSPQEPARRRRLSGEYVRVAKTGLDILEGERISPGTLSRLAECLYILPPSARLLFLGAMISRDTGTIRVVASGLSLEDMIRYLQRLGLRESVGHPALITSISDLADHMWLAIDIGETGVSPRIGFDCYCNSVAQAEDNSSWADLLDFLVKEGICTDHKRDALLDAANMSTRRFDELAWPESVRRVSEILGPAGFNRMGLHIHHIKVIDRPGVSLEAKAYLCGSYR
jgi:hypothetical protein